MQNNTIKIIMATDIFILTMRNIINRGKKAMTDYCASFKKLGSCDKIAGMIFGHALGDAVGLVTEFKENITGVEYPYTESIRGVTPCDWTDDTDLLILTIGSLMENNMKFIKMDIGQRFVYWVTHGLKYTGDKTPKTPNNTFKFIVTQKDYLTDPQATARRVCEQSKGSLCSNSPITRIAIAGTTPDAVNMAKELCTMTHSDPRCVATCIFYCCVLNSLLYATIDLDTIDHIVETAGREACEVLSEEQKGEFINTIKDGMRLPVRAFCLGEMARASNIYKSLSCIMYAIHIIKVALKHGKVPSFKKCIYDVVSYGGDADANGIMVGSILGIFLGYSGLPQDWVKALPNGGQLNQFIAVYTSRLFNPTAFEDNAAAEQNNEIANSLQEQKGIDNEATEEPKATEKPKVIEEPKIVEGTNNQSTSESSFSLDGILDL